MCEFQRDNSRKKAMLFTPPHALLPDGLVQDRWSVRNSDGMNAMQSVPFYVLENPFQWLGIPRF